MHLYVVYLLACMAYETTQSTLAELARSNVGSYHVIKSTVKSNAAVVKHL